MKSANDLCRVMQITESHFKHTENAVKEKLIKKSEKPSEYFQLYFGISFSRFTQR